MRPGSRNLDSPAQDCIRDERGEPAWVFWAIAGSAGFFICLLVIAIFFDPSVRILHPLQALIYVGIIYLARRHSAWGFGAGCIIAAFWNYIFLAGARWDIWAFLTGRAGGIFIPLQLSAVVAHLVLIAGSIVGFKSLRPHDKRWTAFIGGGVAAVGILIALIFTLRPQSVIVLRRSVGL
jgi:hypothetical protein